MDAQPQRVVPPSRRRDKPVLSCTLCRRRKLKCDRQQPCKTCIDRGLSLSCTFVRNVPVQHEPRAPSSVHDRIDQLEKLVTTLMGSKDIEQDDSISASGSPMPNQDNGNNTDIPGTPDRVNISSDTTSYTNSGHWTSILDGISELKEHLDQIPTSARSADDSSAEVSGPDLLFGRQRHATKHELLAALPQRSEADQLLASYFGSMDTAPTLIHRSSFVKEYENFWKQPFETSTMWLGLLYAVLAIGARFQASSGELHGANAAVDALYNARLNFYREKCVQALILANYTKCPPYTLETCLMYFGSEFVRSPDTQFSIWLLVGMIVRIAFRMGYHRDPSRFANISTYTAEIRRRQWLVVLSIDLVSSAQVGLPRMIQPFMYDTQEPRNLYEESLFEEMTELPPPVPETEQTPLLYTILLTRIRTVHAKIMDLMNATSQPPYREIMNLESVVRHVYDQVPDTSKPIPVDAFDSAIDVTTMRRLYLGLSFNKAELMLHRPYLLMGRTDPKYEYSRRVCLNAAYDILLLQQRVDAEIRPGGRLWSPGWQIFTMSWYLSSIVAQDFLLATTIMVSDLDGDFTSGPSCPRSDNTTSGLNLYREPPTQQQKIDILHGARKIWIKASKRSHEARKVAEAITLVLSKAGVDSDLMNGPSTGQVATEQPSMVSPAPSFDLNEFTADPSNAAFFMGNGAYNNPFLMNDMPMDPGAFSNAFNWPTMPSNPFGEAYPPQPFQ